MYFHNYQQTEKLETYNTLKNFILPFLSCHLNIYNDNYYFRWYVHVCSWCVRMVMYTIVRTWRAEDNCDFLLSISIRALRLDPSSPGFHGKSLCLLSLSLAPYFVISMWHPLSSLTACWDHSLQMHVSIVHSFGLQVVFHHMSSQNSVDPFTSWQTLVPIVLACITLPQTPI